MISNTHVSASLQKVYIAMLFSHFIDLSYTNNKCTEWHQIYDEIHIKMSNLVCKCKQSNHIIIEIRGLMTDRGIKNIMKHRKGRNWRNSFLLQDYQPVSDEAQIRHWWKIIYDSDAGYMGVIYDKIEEKIRACSIDKIHLLFFRQLYQQFWQIRKSSRLKSVEYGRKQNPLS